MRVKHPVVPNYFMTIPDDDIAAWEAQGWQRDDTAPATDAPPETTTPPETVEPSPSDTPIPPPSTPSFEEEK